jgi:hypothetical protein
MDEVRAVFICSPRKSIRHATRQLNMPHITVWEMSEIYKLQVPTVAACNYPRQRSSLHILLRHFAGSEDDKFCTAKIVISDEAIFHTIFSLNLVYPWN